MRRFISKPVTVQAWHNDGTPMPHDYAVGSVRRVSASAYEVLTPLGWQRAGLGSWVLHGPDGRFSVLGNDEFEAAFSEVVPAAPIPAIEEPHASAPQRGRPKKEVA